jgi:hypothetical protein
MRRGLHLTIDEWFYSWFASNDVEKVSLVDNFFERVLEVCDLIVIQRGTRLARKFYELAEIGKAFPPDPKTRDRVQKLLHNFYRQEKFLLIDEVQDLQEEIIPQLPRKDLYLVQICLQTNEKYIITSDTTLYQNLIDTRDALGIVPYMVEDFINAYPNFQ